MIENAGRPATKLLVPSSGSMSQICSCSLASSKAGSWEAASSPMTGQAISLAKFDAMKLSARRSTLVTNSPEDLFSISSAAKFLNDGMTILCATSLSIASTFCERSGIFLFVARLQAASWKARQLLSQLSRYGEWPVWTGCSQSYQVRNQSVVDGQIFRMRPLTSIVTKLERCAQCTQRLILSSVYCRELMSRERECHDRHDRLFGQ